MAVFTFDVIFYLRDFIFFLNAPALFSFLAATFALLLVMGPGPDKLERPVLLIAEADLLDFLALLLRSAIADFGALPDPPPEFE
jgi:hypothetical protein